MLLLTSAWKFRYSDSFMVQVIPRFCLFFSFFLLSVLENTVTVIQVWYYSYFFLWISAASMLCSFRNAGNAVTVICLWLRQYLVFQILLTIIPRKCCYRSSCMVLLLFLVMNQLCFHVVINEFLEMLLHRFVYGSGFARFSVSSYRQC